MTVQVAVAHIRFSGRHADDHDLYLMVSPSSAKRWIQRIIVVGRRRDLGLGGFPLVSLEEARAKALAFRKIVWTRTRDVP